MGLDLLFLRSRSRGLVALRYWGLMEPPGLEKGERLHSSIFSEQERRARGFLGGRREALGSVI